MRIPALSLVLLLTACSSTPNEEDLKSYKELEVAAKALVDDARPEDKLDHEEAWLEANKRQELDAYAAKHEAAPVERLRKIIAATRALGDLRATIREQRLHAATVAAASATYQDSATSEHEREDLARKLTELRIMLRADKREQELSYERYQKAKAALGVDAFGGKK